MQKKSFILTSFTIAFMLFAILPIINYITDPSRVLHHDYTMRYKKFHQHELVLKTIYVIEHKHDYDTLVFGSSRGGFMDMEKISKHAYNMSHGFGTVSTYLHTLETLLKSGVTVKNVWIGINDYDIWKDHTKELSRLIYHNNMLEDAKLYSHWLFRFIPESVNILVKHKALIETKEVTDQEPRLIRSRSQEADVRKMKHRHLMAAKLGYTGKFRIDESIVEIKKIKELCEKNHIKLTAFMYPTYYKTYLFYDQSKIEEFKRKLVQVMDFYDFYDIDSIALNQHKWFEGSHFVTSVGDYIIDSIQNKKHLVTQENIEVRIKQIRKHLYYMPILQDEDIYLADKHMHLDAHSYKTIFDLNDKHFTYAKNNQFKFKESPKGIEASVHDTDPHVTLNKTHTDAKKVIFLVNMESLKESLFQIYFKTDKKSGYSENNSLKLALHKGNNTFRIIISKQYINNSIRVDFARNLGLYKINQFIIKEIPEKKEHQDVQEASKKAITR